MSPHPAFLPRSEAEAANPDHEQQAGASMILVAFLMTVLVGFAAFSVDFGWLYLNGLRIQHGADAAALAGVIYEPGDQATAYNEARRSASENGYSNAAMGTTVTPVDFSDDPAAVENANQLAVTIQHEVPTFFMRIFGFDGITIGKTAVAEYVLPLPMGSDLPYFGTDPSNPARRPGFWANIHGYFTGRGMGDRFASQCNSKQKTASCDENPEDRDTIMSGGIPVAGGYVYGIELDDTASNLSVEIFDGAFYQDGHNNFLVGDNPAHGEGPTTWFILYAPDPTPLNTSDNEVLCTVRYTPQPNFADFDGDGDIGSWDGGAELWRPDPDDDRVAPNDVFDWADVEDELGVNTLWDQMCGTTFSRGAGIYPLRVVIEHPGAVDDRGLNRYSLRSSSTGNQPRFYGLGDIAIYANFTTSSAVFNLAEVYPVHAGKDLVIELWDPDSGNDNIEIRLPDGSLPQCTWTSTDPARPGGGPMACSIAHTGFDDDHMQIRIDIADDYTCDTDPVTGNCWWTIEVDYNKTARDTTTWSSRIEGNPVKLVK